MTKPPVRTPTGIGDDPMRLDIDLAFSVTVPATDSEPESTVNGTVKAHGTDVVISTDTTDLYRVGPRADMTSIRGFAQELSEWGLSVSLASPEGTIVSLGAVKANAAQRVLTRSAHIRPGKVGAWSALLRGSSGDLTQSLVPPGTPFPLSPTFQRNYRMRPTTTHYTSGGGRPRLIFVRDGETWDGLPAQIFELTADTTVIGGGTDADLVLPETIDAHATITHSADDEYILTAVGPVSGSTRLPEGDSYTLRTGARIGIGPWRLVFVREEYADHGRPYGGRQGGELAYQRPQYDHRYGTIERDGIYGLGNPRED